jgi:hypothetical protein
LYLHDYLKYRVFEKQLRPSYGRGFVACFLFLNHQDLARIFKEQNRAADPLSLVLGGAVSSRVLGDTEAKARDEGEDPEAGTTTVTLRQKEKK